jgi:hypothetical protein
MVFIWDGVCIDDSFIEGVREGGFSEGVRCEV